MPIYIDFFHGRNDPSENLDDWGYDGPVMGPFEEIRYTYGTLYLRRDGLQVDVEPTIVNADCVELWGSYYGDYVLTDCLEKAGTLYLRPRHCDTDNVLNMKDNELPLLINDKRPWVKNYVEWRLKRVNINASQSALGCS